jgi:hypothetical protein
MLIVVFAAIVLCAAAGTGIWALAHGHSSGSPNQASPLLSPSGIATDAWTQTSAPPDTAEPYATDSPYTDPSPATTAGPDAAVTSYYDAINSGDFRTAWDLGGKNFSSSYSSFVSGFSGTRQDTVTIVSVQGDTVSVDISAYQTDGTQRTFAGTYTVFAGVITDAHIQQTN